VQKWEYCVIGAVHRLSGDRLLLGDRAGVEHFSAGARAVRAFRSHDELGQAIAQLGDEGWEMVGCGNTGEGSHVLYFKRPKHG